MVVPSTANSFRAAVSALRPLDGGRLWVSTPSRFRRTAVCGFWWKTWTEACLTVSSRRSSSPGHHCPGSHAAAFRPLWPGPSQGLPSHSPLNCIGGTGVWCVQSAINHRTLWPASVGGVIRGSKGPIAMQALPALRPHTTKLRIWAPVCRVRGLPPIRLVPYPTGAASVLRLLGVTTRRTIATVLSGKRWRRPFQSRRPSVSIRAPPRATPTLQNFSGPGPLPSRWTWARAEITLSRGCVAKATTTPIPNPNPWFSTRS